VRNLRFLSSAYRRFSLLPSRRGLPLLPRHVPCAGGTRRRLLRPCRPWWRTSWRSGWSSLRMNWSMFTGDIRATRALLQGQRVRLLKAFRNSGRSFIRLTRTCAELNGASIKFGDGECTLAGLGVHTEFVSCPSCSMRVCPCGSGLGGPPIPPAGVTCGCPTGLTRWTTSACGAILRSTDIEDGPVPCPPALDRVTWGFEILASSSVPPII
jgi:hypothetical protein